MKAKTQRIATFSLHVGFFSSLQQCCTLPPFTLARFLTYEVYSLRCAKVEGKNVLTTKLTFQNAAFAEATAKATQFSTMYYLMLSFTHILVRGVSGRV